MRSGNVLYVEILLRLPYNIRRIQFLPVYNHIIESYKTKFFDRVPRVSPERHCPADTGVTLLTMAMFCCSNAACLKRNEASRTLVCTYRVVGRGSVIVTLTMVGKQEREEAFHLWAAKSLSAQSTFLHFPSCLRLVNGCSIRLTKVERESSRNFVTNGTCYTRVFL